jgi:hypothetical protein
MYPGCAHHLRRFSTVIQRLPTGVVDPGLSGRRAVGVPSANRLARAGSHLGVIVVTANCRWRMTLL